MNKNVRFRVSHHQVGWVKQCATQKYQNQVMNDNVGFRVSTQPTGDRTNFLEDN